MELQTETEYFQKKGGGRFSSGKSGVQRVPGKRLKYKPKKLGAFDDEKRKCFLDVISLGRSASAASRAAEVSLQTAYNERDRNPAFAEAWKMAYESGTHHFEDVAAARAETKSDTMLIVTLKARDPNKYIERRALEVNNTVNINVIRAKEELASVPKEQLLESLAMLESPVIENKSEESSTGVD